MDTRRRFLMLLLVLPTIFCVFPAEGKSPRRAAGTSPAFRGCTRISLREFDKSPKTYMIYAKGYDLLPHRLSPNGRRKLSNIVNASGILSKVIPAGGEQPLGHYKEIFFEFGPRSRWVVYLPVKAAAKYASVTGFITRYGRYMDAIGVD